MSANKHNLLFVDDEEDIISALYDTFADDYNIFKTTDPKEALEIAKKEDIALVISDQRMPEMTGSELLAEIYNAKPQTLRVLLTGYADINAAVDAINKGAIHKYAEKPWNDEELLDMVASLVQIYEESKEKLSVLSRVQGIIKNESSFKTIMNNIKEGVCAMSEGGDIHFANISALNILGYKSIDESQSKKIFDIAESDFDDFKKEFKEKKKVKAKIITASAKDESPVDVLLTPIFEEDERMVGVIFQGI
jgi:PAS domain S-box-containing protein